jgi:hypothetical protein
MPNRRGAHVHDYHGIDPSQPSGGSATGDERVDEALVPLETVHELPVREQVAVFDAVHAALQDRLADVED